MDGKNCTGRKISLLNDSSDVASAPTKVHQPPPLTAHHHHHHSRPSSCDSTPCLSPKTPQLSRSSSSDSRAFGSPSPLTPASSSFESSGHHSNKPTHPAHHHHHHYYIVQPNSQYSKMDDQNGSMYPPIPDSTGSMPSAYPMPPHMTAQMPPQQHRNNNNNLPLYRSSTSPSSEPSRVSTVSAASNKVQPKKNQYPCPMAKQVGCTDYFTTSGHAARHAKKHTGKKDAFCPECNKAFTRKDNMEQHRRTHQNGRGASRTANTNNEDSKVKKATRPPVKRTTMKSEPMLEAAVEQQLADRLSANAPIQSVAQAVQAQAQAQAQADAQQHASDHVMLLPPSGPYYLSSVDTGPVPPLPMAMPDLNMRPPLHRSNFATSLDYMPPAAAMVDPDTLHYSYPSPGLSNGLNSLALAASEHRRMSEEKQQSQSPQQESL